MKVAIIMGRQRDVASSGRDVSYELSNVINALKR